MFKNRILDSIITESMRRIRPFRVITLAILSLRPVMLKDVMEFAGHKDVKTFVNHYCFSSYSEDYKCQQQEKYSEMKTFWSVCKVYVIKKPDKNKRNPVKSEFLS